MGYNPVIFFVKLSLFLLYFHFFGVSRRIRILIYVGIGSIFSVYTTATILARYSCFPSPRTGRSWSEAFVSPMCVAQTRNATYIVGAFGVVSDFYILGLPIPSIIRLQLPRKEKIGVFALFMTGFL